MVAIRTIIAVATVLASIGCSTPYRYSGEWLGERSIQFAPGTQPSAEVSLKRVRLSVLDDGQFTLIDMSIPMEGRLELDAQQQTLSIDRIAGQPTGRSMSSAAPTYRLTWLNDGTLSLSGSQAGTVTLARQKSPPGSK